MLSRGSPSTLQGEAVSRAGELGSAGRRAVLKLGTPIGDMVAIVFQHQSVFGEAKHYEERLTLGWSGRQRTGAPSIGLAP